jgi:hypothetical protein
MGRAGLLFARFSAIFTEPGHLGTVTPLLLYINRYNIKNKYVFIILMGTLLSFSLVAYVLTILGYFIYKTLTGGKLYRKIMILIVGVTLIAGTGFIIYKKYQNSLLYQLIIARLEYDDDKGFHGNNRMSNSIDTYYKQVFIKSPDFWGGVGLAEIERLIYTGRGERKNAISGYRGYILQFGFIGIFFLCIFYLSMTFSVKSRLLFGLFVLYFISAIQRTVPATWEICVFLFIGAIEIFRVKHSKC